MAQLRFSLVLCVATFFFFFLLKEVLGLGPSCHVLYYPHLAQSFLDGRLDLTGFPVDALDLTLFKGKVYAYWPPLTSFLMAPFVAFLGADAFPQRLFAMAFAALNTGLFYLLAERFLTAICPRKFRKAPLVVALAYGLGTSNLLFGVVANHWWIGQLTAAPFLLLALWNAFDRDPKTRRRSALLSFFFLALAILGRQPLVFFAPLLLFLAWSDAHYEWTDRPWGDRLRWGLYCIAPLVAVGLFFAWYNHARFGAWLENGVGFSNQSAEFQPNYRQFGTVSGHYVVTNAYLTLLRLPGFQRFDQQGGLACGFSLFAQSPLLLGAFRSGKTVAHATLRRMIWMSVLLAALPGFFVLGGGYAQFGARYLFDEVPGLLLIVLMSLSSENFRWVVVGAGVSAAINLYGLFAVMGKAPF